MRLSCRQSNEEVYRLYSQTSYKKSDLTKNKKIINPLDEMTKRVSKNRPVVTRIFNVEVDIAMASRQMMSSVLELY